MLCSLIIKPRRSAQPGEGEVAEGIMREQPELVHTGALPTAREMLRRGAELLCEVGVESARVDAELLLCHVLGWSREKLWLHQRESLKATQRELFGQALQRRAQREPVAYITGVREFWSLDFLVSPAVLVPRPETELLVEIALRLVKSVGVGDSKLRVLDLGTGSGAIAISLARESENVEVWATDLAPEALKVAEANAVRHGMTERIRFREGDLFEPLKEFENSFDMIISNPPYVKRREMKDLPPDVRDWEPMSALDGGPDGLAFYRRIVEQGHIFLRDGGSMLLEIAADMANEVSELFEKVGRYSPVDIYQDYAGKNRVAAARKRS
jgi:release factor glutamine methyltransferase